MLAVPNFSEGRNVAAIAEVTAGFGRAELLDTHTDAVHNRTVLTLTAPAAGLLEACVEGARACIELIDMRSHTGAHPCIGALDVCPIVWTQPDREPEARELARELAPALGELGVPVFLYGELASEPQRRERAHFRRGGLAALAGRMRAGELTADFGPAQPHPTAGAVLVTARAPLAAFNVELDTADVAVARAIADRLRESGGGPRGVRAIGVDLGDRAQVSTNIHDPLSVTLASVVEQVRELAAEHGASPVAAEVVGLVSRDALGELPADVPVRGFDPALQIIERRLERRTP